MAAHGRFLWILGFLPLIFGAACSSKGSTDAAPGVDLGAADASALDANAADDAAVPLTANGPWDVGFAVATSVTDAKSGRALTVEVWYPTAHVDGASDTALEAQVPPGADHDTLAPIVAAAPSACTRKRVAARAGAPPADAGPLPVVAFSHCKGCVRFSSGEVAERLASQGFLVVAPDHTGDTLFDTLRGVDAPLDGAFLATRAGDVRFALDWLTGGASGLGVSVKPDATRIGVMGHSYGGATSGLVAQDDPRVLAALSFAAPMENPLTPGAQMKNIAKPVAFWLATEDHSITKLGNDPITSNFGAATGRAWLWSVADAGHWSVSDICALETAFEPGCGMAGRQVGGDPFTYLDAATARGLAASFATAFFRATLLGDADARAFLGASPSASVDVKTR